MVLTEGMDLSLPCMIASSGVLLHGLAGGADLELLYAIPAVMIVAVVIGIANGLGVVTLGLSPIVVTLAMNGIIQGGTLLYSGGTPDGFAPDTLRWLMAGMAPVMSVLVLFLAEATVLLSRSVFGRRATGSKPPRCLVCRPALAGKPALAGATISCCPASQLSWRAGC